MTGTILQRMAETGGDQSGCDAGYYTDGIVELDVWRIARTRGRLKNLPRKRILITAIYQSAGRAFNSDVPA
jgi:hypothetical protein